MSGEEASKCSASFLGKSNILFVTVFIIFITTPNQSKQTLPGAKSPDRVHMPNNKLTNYTLSAVDLATANILPSNPTEKSTFKEPSLFSNLEGS